MPHVPRCHAGSRAWRLVLTASKASQDMLCPRVSHCPLITLSSPSHDRIITLSPPLITLSSPSYYYQKVGTVKHERAALLRMARTEFERVQAASRAGGRKKVSPPPGGGIEDDRLAAAVREVMILMLLHLLLLILISNAYTYI